MKEATFFIYIKEVTFPSLSCLSWHLALLPSSSASFLKGIMVADLICFRKNLLHNRGMKTDDNFVDAWAVDFRNVEHSD